MTSRSDDRRSENVSNFLQKPHYEVVGDTTSSGGTASTVFANEIIKKDAQNDV